MASALMYPNINITDVKSIKAYLFFYDTLYRIVPNEVSPDDSREIEQLIDSKKGIISPIRPGRFNEEAFLDFKKKIDEWSYFVGISHLKRWKRTARIHQDKVCDELYYRFAEEMGATIKGNWLEIDEQLASIYMLSLANTTATKNSLALVTDFDSAWTIQEFINYGGSYCKDDHHFDSYWEEDEKNLGIMILSQYLPDNYESLSFETILNYRDDFKNERRQLLTKMDEFQNYISNVESPEVFMKEVQSYVEDIEEAVTSYRSSLTGLNKKVGSGALNGFLAGCGLISSLPILGDIAWLLPQSESILALGISFGTIWGLHERSNKELALRKQNSHSYLYYLKNHKFSATGIKNDLSRLTRELVLD